MASTDENREEWRAIRAFVYQLAHTVFSGEPNADLFAVLASQECRDTLHGAGKMSGDAMKALAGFCDGLVDAATDLTACVEKSLSEYNRAIAGLGANRESHPWESAYTSSRKLLFQVETLEVRNAYRAFGYLPEMYPKVADDHIALECAFLAALARKMLDEPDDGKYSVGSRDFLRDHLLRWIDDYAAAVHIDVPDGLYDLTASALAEFVHVDVVLLEAEFAK